LAPLSGIFLGLAIFAKIPGFAFIPLVGYLVFTHSNRSVKSIALFLAPVILIPLIWPAYAFSANEYDKWLDGIDFQTSRVSKPLSESIDSFFSTDPILLLLGVAGTIFAAVIKKDIIFVLWILPFVIFLYLIDYVSSFFLIPLLPPLCIAAAVMIVDLCSRIARKKKRLHSLLPYGVIAAIGIYGLSITTPLLNQSENLNYFEVISAVSDTLPVNDMTTSDTMDTQAPDGKMTVIGSPSYYWMLQYVFDKPQYNYKTQYNLISKSTLENILDESEKVILIADGSIMKVINKETPLETSKAELRADRLILIYNNTKVSDTVDEVQIRTNF
jgi:4-amino-4-deoxy-L-arabinose transferase-like glycosyltransferase